MIKTASIARFILVVIFSAILPACGGGGGSGTVAVPMTATLKLATVGTAPDNLSGIDITLALPTGVTPALNMDGTVAATAVSPGGVTPAGAVVVANHTPATATTKGSLRISLISVTGFGVGEFTTVTLNVAPGSNPAQSDFIISGFDPLDMNLNHVLTLSAALTSLVIK